MTQLVVALCLAATPPATTPLAMPGGEGGIGFDDLVYSAALQKVLVPSGRTGRLNLVNPKDLSLESIAGFGASTPAGEGHGAGTTSAAVAHGLIFASDRTKSEVEIVDPAKKSIVGKVALAGRPDYVRWVEPTSEVWVTEPKATLIEIFGWDGAKLTAVATITIPDGPESLAIDVSRGRAYTHTWHDETMAIDLKSRTVVARWKNGCQGARGIALDEKRGLLFVGCEEGRAVTLDVAHDGKALGQIAAGKGVDIIAWAPALGHLYVPGGDDATLTVAAVGAKGELSLLGTVPAAADAHCVVADELGNAYVCDPTKGRLLVFHDTFPPVAAAP